MGPMTLQQFFTPSAVQMTRAVMGDSNLSRLERFVNHGREFRPRVNLRGKGPSSSPNSGAGRKRGTRRRRRGRGSWRNDSTWIAREFLKQQRWRELARSAVRAGPYGYVLPVKRSRKRTGGAGHA